MSGASFAQASLGYRGMRRSRCAGCRLIAERCLCNAIAPVACAIPVWIHLHASEFRRPSNTGWLVERMVAGARIQVQGGGGRAAFDGGRWLRLCPTGRPLRPKDRGAGLVVADGTWSQVRRMTRRIPSLLEAEPVRIDAHASVPPIRRGARPELLCTAEAVARALGILGEPEAEQALLSVLTEWALRTLAGRRDG